MSAHSTAASRSTSASIRSASRCRYGARPAGPSAAQRGRRRAPRARRGRPRPRRRAPPPASGRPSIGERSAKRSRLGDALAADEVVGRRPGRSRPRRCVRGLDQAHSSLDRLEIVDGVGEREAEAGAHPDRREHRVLLVRRLVQRQRRRALPDLRDRAVAATAPGRARGRRARRGARRRAVGSGARSRAAARCGSAPPSLGLLERDRGICEPVAVRTARAAVAARPGAGPGRPRSPARTGA